MGQMHADDMDLVREFAASGSDAAFATLVRRHVNLVYSAALRRLGNAPEAEEVAQLVFIILARKARSLRRGTILSGWLYQTARLTAANFQRAAIRRQHREQEAFMQFSEQSEPNASWHRLSPLLEEAMARLGQKERDAIVLRFFENRTILEVATALGLREDAAQKRVNRATDKLRDYFVRRGIQVSTAALLASLGTHAVQAAPAELASKIVATAALKGAIGSGSTLTLIEGALKIMAWTKLKTGVISAVIVVAVAATTTTLVIQHQHHLASQNDVSRDAWVFSGYGDPKSAMMSFLWAIRQADGAQILAACSPGLQQTFQKHFQEQMRASGKTLDEFLAQDTPPRFSTTTGIRILEQKSDSEDQITLRLLALGEQKEHRITVKKIGEEWKVDGVMD